MIWNRQRGDTLVEVAIAFAILAMVLASCLVLGTSAMRVGNDSKQRSQAAEFAQEQAEALRGFRDKVGWAAFVADPQVSSLVNVGSSMHMVVSGSNWVPTAGSFRPNINGVSSIFTVDITCTKQTSQEYQFHINVVWPGMGVTDAVTFDTVLVNTSSSVGYQAL